MQSFKGNVTWIQTGADFIQKFLEEWTPELKSVTIVFLSASILEIWLLKVWGKSKLDVDIDINNDVL